MKVVLTEELPRPMTSDEEHALRLQIQKGDPNARQELIMRNIRLVLYVARELSRKGLLDEDEAFSEGYFGLVKGAMNFDPDRSERAVSYLIKCIRNEVFMYLRKSSRGRSKITYFDKVISRNHDGEQTLAMVLGKRDSLYDRLEWEEEIGYLREALNMLRPFEKELISLRFYHRLKHWQIGQQLGISRSYVSKLIKEAVEELRNNYQKVSSFRASIS